MSAEGRLKVVLDSMDREEGTHPVTERKEGEDESLCEFATHRKQQETPRDQTRAVRARVQLERNVKAVLTAVQGSGAQGGRVKVAIIFMRTFL